MQLNIDVRKFLGSVDFDVDEMFEVAAEFKAYFKKCEEFESRRSKALYKYNSNQRRLKTE